MAIYEDQYAEHPVHEVLSQLQAALKQKHNYDLDEIALDAYDRLNQATGFIEQRLLGSSPVLNSVGKLGQVHKGINASLTEVNQYLSNGNSAHLANAALQMDTGVNFAATLVTISNGPPSVRAADAISFKNLAESAIAQIQLSADNAHAKQASFSASVDEFEGTTAALKNEIAHVKEAADEHIATLETRYEAENAERSVQFDEALAASEKRASDAITESNNKVEKLLAAISQKKEEAERIVQLVGNVGLTGNYKGAGDVEQQSADKLRYFALGCFIATGIFVGAVVLLSATAEFNAMKSGFRLLASLVFLVPGTYAAKESAKHRVIGTRHRRAELELASINAYLDDLPPEERNKLKASLTDRFFGHANEDQKIASDAVTFPLVDLLKQAIDGLSKK